jgi:hypothetical protein
MAKRQKRGRPAGGAATLGQMLRGVASKIENWRSTRDEIAGELSGIVSAAQGMLSELGVSAAPRRGRPGRTRKPAAVRTRRKMSAKARKAISDAQKKRWAAQKATKK